MPKYNVVGMLLNGGLGKDMNSGVRVPYMNEAERLRLQVGVVNGRLYQGLDMMDTSNAPNGQYLFVMDMDGRIFSAPERLVAHHSAFLAGRPVAAAGTLEVAAGTLVRFSDQSGHYQPPKDYTTQFVKELTSRGVRFTAVEKAIEAKTKSAYKKAYKKRGLAPRPRLYTPEPPKLKAY